MIDFVNKYFIAEIPRFAGEENQNVFQDDGELQFDAMYRKKAMELVRTYNIHQCVDAINGCLKGTRCRRGYNCTAPIPETYIDDAKSRVVYPRRDSTTDLRIVPYNLPMMMDWGSHLNVEYSGSAFSALYIYKYCYKGAFNRELIELKSSDEIHDSNDEIKLFIYGRVMCCMAAVWRLYSLQRNRNYFKWLEFTQQRAGPGIHDRPESSIHCCTKEDRNNHRRTWYGGKCRTMQDQH